MLRKRINNLKATLLCLVPLMFTAPSMGYAETTAPKINDAAIIAIYNQVNNFDIETALLGQVYGHSPDVQSFGKMVATDHTGVRKAAHELAIRIGVTPDLPSSRAPAALSHYKSIGELRNLSGQEFDRAYLLHEIAFHTAAINAVKTALLPAAQHSEIKEHFTVVLPHFQHHLNEAKRIAKALGVK